MSWACMLRLGPDLLREVITLRLFSVSFYCSCNHISHIPILKISTLHQSLWWQRNVTQGYQVSHTYGSHSSIIIHWACFPNTCHWCQTGSWYHFPKHKSKKEDFIRCLHTICSILESWIFGIHLENSFPLSRVACIQRCSKKMKIQWI